MCFYISYKVCNSVNGEFMKYADNESLMGAGIGAIASLAGIAVTPKEKGVMREVAKSLPTAIFIGASMLAKDEKQRKLATGAALFTGGVAFCQLAGPYIQEWIKSNGTSKELFSTRKLFEQTDSYGFPELKADEMPILLGQDQPIILG